MSEAFDKQSGNRLQYRHAAWQQMFATTCSPVSGSLFALIKERNRKTGMIECHSNWIKNEPVWFFIIPCSAKQGIRSTGFNGP
jgi:hypothetical protein